MTLWNDAPPLAGSLDPAELGDNVRLPRNAHFVGGDDGHVTVAIVEKFPAPRTSHRRDSRHRPRMLPGA
ncbi:MAG: hypothetical protein IPL72_05585 [Sulfuritalea sp.]|nr:hypothetical protein [Sulfuritalea sp.]